MLERFFVVGVSHKECTVKERGLVYVSKSCQKSFLDNFSVRFGLKGIVVLSTCNRIEIYGEAGDTFDKEEILSSLSSFFQLSTENYSLCPYQKTGIYTVSHLFKVASGLSSMLVGENEILGQVRDAYYESFRCGRVGTLHKIFQQAIHVGKWVRANTNIAKGSTSIASVCVDLIKKNFNFSLDSWILVVGAGSVAKSFVRDLSFKGYKNILLCNRTIAKSQEIAKNYKIRVVPFGKWKDFLCQMSVVMVSTSANECIISESAVSEMQKNNKTIPIFIDLSVPGCIDSKIATVKGSTLYTLDHVDEMVRKNVQFREEESRRANILVEAQLENFLKQYQKHYIFSLLHKLYGEEGLNKLQNFLLKWGKNNINSPVQKEGFITVVKKVRSPKDFSSVTDFFVENESLSKEICSMCPS